MRNKYCVYTMFMVHRIGGVSKQVQCIVFVLVRLWYIVEVKIMYDVAIIGAGVVGALIARSLAKYEIKICLIEKENDVAMGATCANSAIVHAGFDAKPDSMKAKLNVRGSEMMENIAKELGVKYNRNGSLVVGFNYDDKCVLEELLHRGEKNGVKGLEIVEGRTLHALESNLSEEVICALYAPTGAIICPYELTIAAVGNAMDNGADLKRNFEVINIKQNDSFYEIYSDTELVKAKFVINAAGIYADRIAEMIGDSSFTIHPRMGEYILLDKECGDMVSHTIFRTPTQMGKGILITPTVDGNLLLGPTSADGTDKEGNMTTVEGFERIMNEAGKSVKNIPFGKTITSFCGLRAVGDTGDFIINSPKDGFINAAGIESPGLSASPAIAEYITEMLSKQRLKLTPKKDYNPIRKPAHYFREMSAEEKNELIKRDKSYGRVICRCETITEGEIIEAIHQNPSACDLDGIKRRTRAQMGRCQGGFCMTYIAEILARELNISCEGITKCGDGSEIITGKTKGVR